MTTVAITPGTSTAAKTILKYNNNNNYDDNNDNNDINDNNNKDFI